jgi:hypothetical protein
MKQVVAMIALWAVVHLPSIAVANAAWGGRVAGLVALVSFVATVGGGPTLWRWLALRSERRRRRLAWTGAALSLAAILVVTPHRARVVGFGSDRNEAVTLGTRALLHGSSPYAVHTSRDMPLSPLPGELIVAAPVVWLTDNAAWELAIWWVLWLLAASRLAPPDQRGLFLIALLAVCTSLMLPYQAVLGEDLLWTGLVVAVAVTLFVTIVPRTQAPTWQKLGSAVLLGVSLASRLPWMLALVSVAAVCRTRAAVGYWLVSLAVWAALVLPFWFLAAEFGPFSNPAVQVPPVAKALLLVAACVYATRSARRHGGAPWRVLADVTIVQAGLILATTVGNSIAFRRIHVGTLGYLALVQGCGMLALADRLTSAARSMPAAGARAVTRSNVRFRNGR